MIPLLKTAEDVKRTIDRLPYTAPSERTAIATACRKKIKGLKVQHQITVKDEADCMNSLRRYLA